MVLFGPIAGFAFLRLCPTSPLHGRQAAAAEAMASRATYRPAGDFGRRHLDEESPIPGARGTIWSVGQSSMTYLRCLGVPVHDRAPAGPRPVVQVVDFSATAQGWISSDKIRAGTFEVGKSIVEDVGDRHLRTVSRLPSYPADVPRPEQVQALAEPEYRDLLRGRIVGR
jgi:hypothetical protein